MTENIEEVLKKYDLSEREVLAWASKKHPRFRKNLRLMTIAYLAEELGINADPYDLGLESPMETTKVEDIPRDVFTQIEVLVASKISEFDYLACPQCKKKVDEDNVCEKHGAVEPELAIWKKYTAGDETGDLVLTLSPSIEGNSDVTGKLLEAQGTFRSAREEFVARRYRVLDEFFDAEDEDDGREVEKPKKKAKPSTKISKKKAKTSEEIEMLRQFVKVYGGVPKKQLEAWHKTKGLKTTVEELIEDAGLKEKDGKFYVD